LTLFFGLITLKTNPSQKHIRNGQWNNQILMFYWVTMKMEASYTSDIKVGSDHLADKKTVPVFGGV